MSGRVPCDSASQAFTFFHKTYIAVIADRQAAGMAPTMLGPSGSPGPMRVASARLHSVYENFQGVGGCYYDRDRLLFL